MKATDYHRDIIARYYGKLIKRFGLNRVVRNIERLKRVVWKRRGFELAERRVLT